MANTINKQELATKLQLMDAFSASTKKATVEFIEDFFQLLADEMVAGNAISIPGFGKLAPYKKQDGTLKDSTELLDLVNTRPLLSIENEYLGVRGQLKETLTLDALCGNLGRALVMDIHDFRIVGSLDKPIRSLGIIVGSGGSYVRDAIYNGCDVLITGDVKYHDAQLAKEAGILVIDAGHYGTEKSFVANMTEKLKEKIPVKAEIIPSNVLINPFTKL